MAAKVIKEFIGFSGNQIYLMKKDRLFVRKSGNVLRNVERMYALEHLLPMPKIYQYSKNKFDMEYINGLDMKSYLKSYSYDHLLNFILATLDKLSQNKTLKDYTEIYQTKLDEIDFSNAEFTKDDLLESLPKQLPQTNYFGDFTLENILFHEQRGFMMIDGQTSDYDSYIFDIAKLRQDLECHWFMRHSPIRIDVKLQHIQQGIFEQYPEADNVYLLILMLMRVSRYAKHGSFEYNYLIDRANTLWKL
ncbi:MAG: hypothetical protein RLZZ196_121 [Bacteroidota bacterium]|jgi:RIO-like serine/threonine protein kinase